MVVAGSPPQGDGRLRRRHHRRGRRRVVCGRRGAVLQVVRRRRGRGASTLPRREAHWPQAELDAPCPASDGEAACASRANDPLGESIDRIHIATCELGGPTPVRVVRATADDLLSWARRTDSEARRQSASRFCACGRARRPLRCGAGISERLWPSTSTSVGGSTWRRTIRDGSRS